MSNVQTKARFVPVSRQAVPASHQYGIVRMSLRMIQSWFTHKNPYADFNGRPLRGYREQYYKIEQKKRNKYLRTLTSEQREAVAKREKELFQRMQS